MASDEKFVLIPVRPTFIGLTSDEAWEKIRRIAKLAGMDIEAEAEFELSLGFLKIKQYGTPISAQPNGEPAIQSPSQSDGKAV